MPATTKYSTHTASIDQLIKDAQTDAKVRAVFESGTADEKRKLLQDKYGLTSDDVNAIYIELLRVVPEGRFWFW